jgi:hypothetical protein
VTTTQQAVTAVADYLAWALSEGRLGTTSSPADEEEESNDESPDSLRVLRDCA